MILVPFLYFLSFFFFIYKKNGFDVAAYMSLLYSITGLFSIILYSSNVEYSVKELGVVPTVLYCSLITATILPFYGLKCNSRNFNPNKINIKLFNYITYFYIVSFFFTLVLFWDDMIFRLLTADFKEMRGADDAFMQTAQSKLGGPLRTLSSIFGIFNSMSWIMLLFFFYSICFLKRKIIYNALLLLSSTSCIILGIIGIDRSIVYYWLILMILSWVLYYKYIPPKQKKWIIISFSILISVLMAYFVAVTMSRFGDDGADKSGALDSIISYAGQNYINFCWFWKHFDLPKLELSGIFPAISRFVFGNVDGAVDYGQSIELKLGYFINSFYTFLGSWMIYVGQLGSIIMSLLYVFLVKKTLRKKGEVDLGLFIRIFILAIVPLCGAILYIYTSYMRTISGVALFIIAAYVSPKKNVRL